ncbi:IS66 family insertion sequence element accessory protein TnpA [Brevibacillus agri]|uniref:IS66 family insertion sequence element accessory protein TnpA n=1 Tax=Brevibacillus agri TaxID=51101 RepID=UPI003D744493
MTQAELREVWSTRIKDYRASGERVATWCERHQVTPRQLWYWMRKLKGEDEQKQATNKPQWVPLQVDESTSDGALPLLVISDWCLSPPEKCRKGMSQRGRHFPFVRTHCKILSTLTEKL